MQKGEPGAEPYPGQSGGPLGWYLDPTSNKYRLSPGHPDAHLDSKLEDSAYSKISDLYQKAGFKNGQVPIIVVDTSFKDSSGDRIEDGHGPQVRNVIARQLGPDGVTTDITSIDHGVDMAAIPNLIRNSGVLERHPDSDVYVNMSIHLGSTLFDIAELVDVYNTSNGLSPSDAGYINGSFFRFVNGGKLTKDETLKLKQFLMSDPQSPILQTGRWPKIIDSLQEFDKLVKEEPRLKLYVSAPNDVYDGNILWSMLSVDNDNVIVVGGSELDVSSDVAEDGLPNDYGNPRGVDAVSPAHIKPPFFPYRPGELKTETEGTSFASPDRLVDDIMKSMGLSKSLLSDRMKVDTMNREMNGDHPPTFA